MEQNLYSVVLLILDRIETHIKLSEQFKSLNIPELQNLLDPVKRKVQESQRLCLFEPSQESNAVVREIKRA